MSGIQADPRGDISDIRGLLKEYAPGFAFLKELLQNADDAEASILRLAWSPGLPEASHPLLKAPALVAINNGNFTEGDRDGLMRMGLGNKGGDSGKIGKFGLGTKSIFHVAEAFFFFNSSQSTDLRDILNPWSPRFHQDWDEVKEDDWKALDSACRELGSGLDDWFSLWIPLRRKIDLVGVAPIMDGEDAFPGVITCCPDELRSPFLHRSPLLGELLPLLRSLTKVEFVEPDKAPLVFSIDREKNIITQPDSKIALLVFKYSEAGREDDWRSKPGWPQVFDFQDNGSQESIPDKAEWTHSVVMTTAPTKDTAKLRIYWSVFLPVGNKPFFECSLDEGNRDISLFLHGFFFLNSSRTQIDGLNEKFNTVGISGSAKVCREWNRALACETGGLLPMLLERLASWREDGSLKEIEFSPMVNAIYCSPLWESFASALKSEGSLVYCLIDGAWKWQWIPAATRVVTIPKVDNLDDLQNLERITTHSNPDSNIVFAVNFPQRRALSPQGQPFDSQCLSALRPLIGNSELADSEAYLLAKILGACQYDQIPPEWEDVSLFRVRPHGKGAWLRKSLASLRTLSDSKNLFRADESGFAPLLGDAAGDVEAPFIGDSNIPSILDAPNLTAVASANWLLQRTSLSNDPKKRLPAFKKFANRGQFTDTEVRVLRYLAHGQSAHREDSDTPLFYPVPGPSKLWNTAFKTVLQSDLEWGLIDGRFSNSLSDSLKERTHILPCSRDQWPTLLKELGDKAKEVDFSNADEKLISWILTETSEPNLDCLKNLKIHRLDDTTMVSADDETIWLDDGLNVPAQIEDAWRSLRQSHRVLKSVFSGTAQRRQRELFEFRILDASGALKLAATSALPRNYTKLILHFLSFGTPSSATIETLQKSAWLKLDTGDAIAPEAILHLKGMESILSKLFSKLDQCQYHSSGSIQQEIREAKGWDTLVTQVFRSETRVLETIEKLLEHPPSTLAIGYSIKSEEELRNWIDVVVEAENQALFGIRPLLSALMENDRLKERALSLAGVVGVCFDVQHAEQKYLNHLLTIKTVQESAQGELKSKALVVFGKYLEGASSSGCWNELRVEPKLKLFSQAGTWKSANELARPCAGIQTKALLHKNLAEALGLDDKLKTSGDSGRPDESPRKIEISAIKSAKNLRELLAPFRERLPEKAVAILPALLGSDPETEALTAEMLDGISPGSIKDELIAPSIDVDDQQGGSLRERSEQWIFRAKMVKGETVSLESIAGPVFLAPLLDDSGSVFLPNPNGQLLQWAGGNQQVVCIAEPSRFESLSDSNLRETLLESIKSILWWGYLHRSPNLEEVFEKYAKLGQMSLGVARQEILRSADTQLQILGSIPSALKDARQLSNEARTRLAEADGGTGNKKRLLEEGSEADEKARALFLKAFDHNEEVHDELLNGVRRRIAQQQYEIESIPFEILQNADDAAVELLKHSDVNESDVHLVRKFVLHCGADSLTFHYGGRPINSSCGLLGPAADPFRRDLVKMLLLNGSDKNTGEDHSVTGRFGLGFKSVFLLADKPRVISGALAFEIVGGIWPRPLDKDIVESVHSSADQEFGEYKHRTTILLESEPECLAKSTKRFKSLAPLLPVFTRSIETIIVSSEGSARTYRWQPKEVIGSSQMRLGEIETAEGTISHLEISDDSIQWLFQICDGRVNELPENFPWLWVIAPTQEKSLGFALNGPFALDPGRTRLSKQHDDVELTNNELFRRAAAVLQDGFAHLACVKESLANLEITEPYRFWESLWVIMTGLPIPGSDPDGAEHISKALWPKSLAGGYARLLDDHMVLPNGLQKPIRELCKLSSLTHEAKGWLTTATGSHFLEHALIENFTPFNDPGCCCAEGVARQLRDRLDINLKPFGLLELLQHNGESKNRLSPSLTDLLGKDLWPELTNPFDAKFSTVLPPDEASRLSNPSQPFRFLSAAGTWEVSEDLLVSKTHVRSSASDECARSSFAPPKRVLSSDYSAESVRFFLASRPRLQADAEEMAKWIQDSNDSLALAKALDYLASGELSQTLALQLGKQWFMKLGQTTVYTSLDQTTKKSVELVFDMATSENKRRQLQGELGWFEIEPSIPDYYPALPTLEASSITEIWNEKEALMQFTLSGPLGKLVASEQSSIEDLPKLLGSPGTLEGQVAWYKFLCLGCTLGLPLGTEPFERIERLWVNELTDEFWSVTVPTALDEADHVDFNSGLDAFFESKIHSHFRNENASGEDASFWRRVFYDFRKMHHFVFQNHLPATILEFAHYEEAEGRTLINFLKSGKIPQSMQDSNTPRFRGVIGQSMKAPLLFVMRELRRLEVLDKRFDSACYFMNSPARRVARQLNWLDGEAQLSSEDFASLVDQSEQVHERMQEELPELVGHFDLPLQLYALQPPL